MPKLAKTIEVKRQGAKGFSLKIDGEEFGYYLAREPITTTTDMDGVGTVNLSLMAERVLVDDHSTFSNHHGTTELEPDEAVDILRQMSGREQQ